MSPSDHPVTRRFIEEAGNTTQALGVGRVVGQIYAFLYFSEQPRTLDDMKDALGISKGSASMGVRQLEQWGAVQKIWVKGDRKDYYTANDYFGQIIRNILSDIMGKRLESLAQAVEAAESELSLRGELSSCSVDKLSSKRPKISPSSATQQPNNSTTLSSHASAATQQPNNSTTLPPHASAATQQPNNSTTLSPRASAATQQPNNSATAFLLTRVQRLRAFQSKVNKTWNNPIVRLMLK